MIVWRNFSVIKPGKMPEAIAIWKKVAAAYPAIPMRISTSSVGGPHRMLCVEAEYADMAEMERGQADFWKTPLGQEFQQAWNPLTDYGGRTEIWRLQ